MNKMNLFKHRTSKDLVKSRFLDSDKDAIIGIINEGMTITGNISFRGKVRIDGKIQGDIKGESLILSESGTIKGEIEVGSFICYGRVEGNVIAERLFVKKTALIEGKMDTTELSIDAGASLMGEVIARYQDIPLTKKLSLQKDKQDSEQKLLDKNYQTVNKMILIKKSPKI